MDRLKAHEAEKGRGWAADHQERIEIFFLPRYAPEQNPDEYLNNDMIPELPPTGPVRASPSPKAGGSAFEPSHDGPAAKLGERPGASRQPPAPADWLRRGGPGRRL